jgi:hypothetical protein
MRRTLKIVLIMAVLLPPVSGIGFFVLFNRLQDTLIEEHRYAKAEANAIKHAYASYTVYSALRSVGVPTARAEALSWRLGVFHEQLEDYIYWSKPDPASEKMRDLYNNWAGVAAAKWRLEQASPSPMSGLPMMQFLMEQGFLLSERPKDAAPDNGDVLAHAIRWMNPRRSMIENDVSNGLARVAARAASD